MGIKVIRVTSGSGDWEGIYIDGILSDEGHSVPFEDLMAAIEGKIVTHWAAISAEDNWLEEEGSLPLRLADCKLVEPIPAWSFT